MTEDIGLKMRRGILVIARNRNAYFHFICFMERPLQTDTANASIERPTASRNNSSKPISYLSDQLLKYYHTLKSQI